ncbi:MAG TPA: hypothetical protein VJN19_09045 [Propionibacteriaceae bacterium]|nr:hypothetical protein [Propionibacteriaceae bacterium]
MSQPAAVWAVWQAAAVWRVKSRLVGPLEAAEVLAARESRAGWPPAPAPRSAKARSVEAVGSIRRGTAPQVRPVHTVAELRQATLYAAGVQDREALDDQIRQPLGWSRPAQMPVQHAPDAPQSGPE